MQYDIFSVGDNVADYYPEQKKIYAGGGAYNLAVIAKRLGAKSAYYGSFGTDQNAKFLYETLKKENVGYPIEDIRKGRNAVSIIENKKGKSTVKAVDKGVYKALNIDNHVLKIIKNSKIVHSNIYSYFEDYLTKLNYQTTLSFDFSYLRNKDYIKDIIPKIDIAFFSESKKEENPREFLNWVSDLGVKVVVLTQGADAVLMKIGDEIIEKKPLKTDVVDTLGAGDAFIAAFLTSLIREENNYKKALEEGLKTSAKYCGVKGGLGVSQSREKAVTIHNNVHQ